VLHLFNNTRQLAALLLGLLLVVLHIPGLLYDFTAGDTTGGVLYDWMIWLTGHTRTGQVLLGMLWVLLTALLLNRIVIERRVLAHRDYYVAAGFLVLASALPVFHIFSPAMGGAVFVLLAINRLMDLAKAAEKQGIIYETGLLMGLAGLMSPYYYVFLIPTILGLFSFGAFRIREIAALLIGWLNVFILAGAIYFLFDSWDVFVRKSMDVSYALYMLVHKWDRKTYIVLQFFLLILILAVLLQPRLAIKQQYHAKQFVRVVYNFLLTAGASLLFVDLYNKPSLLYLLIPYSAAVLGVYVKRYGRNPSLLVSAVFMIAFLVVLLNLYRFHWL